MFSFIAETETFILTHDTQKEMAQNVGML